jgi:hypothetical protein
MGGVILWIAAKDGQKFLAGAQTKLQMMLVAARKSAARHPHTYHDDLSPLITWPA